MSVTFLKSITNKSIGIQSEAKKHLGKPMAHIAGVVVEYFEHTGGQHGPSIGFKGDIVAVNRLTGEVFESDVVFLPRGLTDKLIKQLDAGAGHEVEFLADILAVENKKNSQGYAWIAEAPKTEARATKREEMKLAALQVAQKALAAPAKNPKK